MDPGDVVAHVVFAGEAAGMTLAVWNGAEVVLGGVHAMGFFLMAGQYGLGRELHVLAVRMSAIVGFQRGFQVFSGKRSKNVR